MEAVLADARATASGRGEPFTSRSRLQTAVEIARMMWVSDAFFAQVMYRLKVALQVRRVPLLPRVAHRLAMGSAQVCIGDPVVIQPGVYIAHGQVVLDGLVEIGAGTVLFPWTTIGLRAGNIQGPTLGENVTVGTGAKIVGPVTVGRGARIGANAVVVQDVAAGATAVGVPAHVATRVEQPNPA